MSALVLLPILFQMNFYAYPILMVFESIGNIFILIYFYRQRHNPCSIYLMHSAITNLLYILSYGLFSIFYMPYYDDTLNALLLCKFSIYIPNSLGQVARTILILACIDRFMITSNRVSFRAFSTLKRAKYFIFITYVFWLIANIHTPIWLVITNEQCVGAGDYVILYTFYIILILGIIPSATLCVFSYLTYRNLRQLHRRIQPADQNTNTIQQRDRNLLILVIAEMIFYIITTALFPATILETAITKYIMPNKSSEYLLTEIFVLDVAAFLLFIYSAAPFYIYMISSKAFRRDFKQLIIHYHRKVMHQPLGPTNPHLNKKVAQHETRV